MRRGLKNKNTGINPRSPLRSFGSERWLPRGRNRSMVPTRRVGISATNPLRLTHSFCEGKPTTGERRKEAAASGQRPAYGLEWVIRSRNLTGLPVNPLRQDPASRDTRGSDLYRAEDFTTLVGGDRERRGVKLSRLNASPLCSADRTVLRSHPQLATLASLRTQKSPAFLGR